MGQRKILFPHGEDNAKTKVQLVWSGHDSRRLTATRKWQSQGTLLWNTHRGCDLLTSRFLDLWSSELQVNNFPLFGAVKCTMTCYISHRKWIHILSWITRSSVLKTRTSNSWSRKKLNLICIDYSTLPCFTNVFKSWEELLLSIITSSWCGSHTLSARMTL